MMNPKGPHGFCDWDKNNVRWPERLDRYRTDEGAKTWKAENNGRAQGGVVRKLWLSSPRSVSASPPSVSRPQHFWFWFWFLAFHRFFVNFTSYTPITLLSLFSQTCPPPSEPPPSTEKKTVSHCGNCSMSCAPRYTLLSTPVCLQMFMAMACWSGTRLLVSAPLLALELH